MTRPLITIHNVETNELIHREMNDEEFAHYEAIQNELSLQEITAIEKTQAKQALLNKLGITEEEAKLLLS